MGCGFVAWYWLQFSFFVRVSVHCTVSDLLPFRTIASCISPFISSRTSIYRSMHGKCTGLCRTRIDVLNWSAQAGMSHLSTSLFLVYNALDVVALFRERLKPTTKSATKSPPEIFRQILVGTHRIVFVGLLFQRTTVPEGAAICCCSVAVASSV